MSDAPSLVRQWMPLRILSGRHCGSIVKEIATGADVSEKTIRRDPELLRQVGFPLEEVSSERRRKTWRLKPSRSQPGLSFSFDEAIALSRGQRLLEPLAGTPFWDVAQAEDTEVHFQRPADFDLVTHLSKSFGVYHGDGDGEASIRGRLLSGVDCYVSKSLWHQNQQLTPDRDGSVLVNFQLADTEEIRHLIISFGAKRICCSGQWSCVQTQEMRRG